MNITGNKKTDNLIKVGLVVGIAYAGFRVFGNIFDRLQRPTGGAPVLPQQPGCNLSGFRKTKIAQEMDAIYNKLSGFNFMLYPEYTNVILGYDTCDLDYAHNYFIVTYGQTLYSLIAGEWDIEGYYTPALNKLSQNGYNQ